MPGQYGTVVGSVTGSDPDAADSLTYSLTNSATGRFAINLNTGQMTVANGSLLNFEAMQAHVITVRTSISLGLIYTESFTITFNDVNEAPTAAADALTGDQFAHLVVEAGVITPNDFDLDGDPVSVVLVDGPGNGALTLNSEGSFVYVPNSVFSGADQFTYYVTDGSLNSAPATVSINIRTTLSGTSTEPHATGTGGSGTSGGSTSTSDRSVSGSGSESNDDTEVETFGGWHSASTEQATFRRRFWSF